MFQIAAVRLLSQCYCLVYSPSRLFLLFNMRFHCELSIGSSLHHVDYAMDADEALKIVRDAAFESQGTWVLLRLGQDPGAARTLELRTALRRCWQHLKEKSGIPHEIGYAAAAILHFHDEAKRNLNENKSNRRELLTEELPDTIQCAFDLLSGPYADTWVVPRPDLGD